MASTRKTHPHINENSDEMVRKVISGKELSKIYKELRSLIRQNNIIKAKYEKKSEEVIR